MLRDSPGAFHSPSHCTLRPRTCALLGWCYYRTKFGNAWSLKWKTFSIWTLPISSAATWWEVNTGLNTWCASCYLLMPQWTLKSSLLKVDLLHYINRYWQWFFFFSSFLSLEKTVIFLEIFVDGVYVCIISNMSILFSVKGRLFATVTVFSQVIYHTLILKVIRRKKVKSFFLQKAHGKCFQKGK